MLSFNQLIDTWNKFFFEPVPSINMGLFRICLALLYFITSISLLRNYSLFFGQDGVFIDYYWRYHHLSKSLGVFRFLPPTNSYVKLVMYSLMISSLSMMVGFYTNISCLFCYILFVSLVHRNPYIFNSGDSILRIVGLLMVFGNSGDFLSIDNYLANKAQLTNVNVHWVQKLIMLQTSQIYLMSIWYKLTHANFWLRGDAIYYVLKHNARLKFPVPKFLKEGIFCILLSWLTIFNQLFVGVGLWFVETNSLCVSLGIMMHLFFTYCLRIALFSYIMITLLVLFIDPVFLQHLISKVL